MKKEEGRYTHCSAAKNGGNCMPECMLEYRVNPNVNELLEIIIIRKLTERGLE